MYGNLSYALERASSPYGIRIDNGWFIVTQHGCDFRCYYDAGTALLAYQILVSNWLEQSDDFREATRHRFYRKDRSCSRVA